MEPTTFTTSYESKFNDEIKIISIFVVKERQMRENIDVNALQITD